MFTAAFDAALAGVFGLLVGSFLNVVIYRLPKMLEREWAAECAQLNGQEPAEQEPFDLVRPRSRCRQCGHLIRWYENIPLLSYAVLGGRCSACKTPIGLRYPMVELTSALLFALCGWRWGLTWQAGAWAVFAAILVCQFLIDLDTQLLPDDLNYPLLWLGLIAAAVGWTVPLSSAVWGAVIGYLSLWSVYHGFRLLTGQHGMGYGDFKLLAALGAWFGADFLLAIILVSSVVGSVMGVALLATRKLANRETPMSFGPFLAGAGLVCMVLGPAEVRQLVPFAFPFSR